MNGFDSLSDGAQKFLKIATAVTLLASVVGYIVRFETERERVLEHFQSEVMFHDSIRRHRIGADSIHRYLLCREAAVVARLARPGGAIVLSGILTEEAGQVVAAFAETGWPVDATVTEDEWTGLLLRAATSPSAPTAH